MPDIDQAGANSGAPSPYSGRNSVSASLKSRFMNKRDKSALILRNSVSISNRQEKNLLNGAKNNFM